MKTLIIGAHGRIGKRITKRMASSDDFEPTAFIRKEEQKSYFEDMGVPTVVESLQHSKEALTEAMKGFDAVVFTAGSGGDTGYDKTLEVDLYGAVKSIDAAKSSGVDRYVMVSAAYSDQPEQWSDSMKPYYIAKHLADRELMRSGLDYTILRPVGLTDADEAGKIEISANPNTLNSKIPREAVAAAVLESLRNDATKGKVMEMSEGSMDVGDAVKAVV